MQDIFMPTCSGAILEEVWKPQISGSLAEMQQEESQLLLGWRTELSGIFQAGPWGQKEPKAPLMISNRKCWRGLKPGDSVVSSQGK